MTLREGEHHEKLAGLMDETGIADWPENETAVQLETGVAAVLETGAEGLERLETGMLVGLEAEVVWLGTGQDDRK